MFVEYWPTAEDEPMAEVVNSTRSWCSRPRWTVPMGRFEPARVLKGSAVDHLQQLRREPGRDLMVSGSISLAQSLLRAGLVDEIQLRVVPTMVGHGRTLLTVHTGRQELTLLEAKPSASGIVSLRYAVTRS
jgi:dihydrofolate reductase